LTDQVNESRRYTVLIMRTHAGHVAFATKLPEVIGRGQGRESAYRDFKARVQGHISGLMKRGVPAPEDDVVAVKFLTVDLDAPGSDSTPGRTRTCDTRSREPF
jgi:predicted RNase H-like HicB family nuclease